MLTHFQQKKLNALLEQTQQIQALANTSPIIPIRRAAKTAHQNLLALSDLYQDYIVDTDNVLKKYLMVNMMMTVDCDFADLEALKAKSLQDYAAALAEEDAGWRPESPTDNFTFTLAPEFPEVLFKNNEIADLFADSLDPSLLWQSPSVTKLLTASPLVSPKPLTTSMQQDLQNVVSNHSAHNATVAVSALPSVPASRIAVQASESVTRRAKRKRLFKPDYVYNEFSDDDGDDTVDAKAVSYPGAKRRPEPLVSSYGLLQSVTRASSAVVTNSIASLQTSPQPFSLLIAKRPRTNTATTAASFVTMARPKQALFINDSDGKKTTNGPSGSLNFPSCELTAVQKASQRRENNRVFAKRSRAQKKAYMTNLESTVDALTDELTVLREENALLKAKNASLKASVSTQTPVVAEQANVDNLPRFAR